LAAQTKQSKAKQREQYPESPKMADLSRNDNMITTTNRYNIGANERNEQHQ
jgi:hypothetical protein